MLLITKEGFKPFPVPFTYAAKQNYCLSLLSYRDNLARWTQQCFSTRRYPVDVSALAPPPGDDVTDDCFVIRDGAHRAAFAAARADLSGGTAEVFVACRNGPPVQYKRCDGGMPKDILELMAKCV